MVTHVRSPLWSVVLAAILPVASADAQWRHDGVPVCTAAGRQDSPVAVFDGSGGVILAWLDYRSSTTVQVYAQRLNAAGVPQWQSNGIPLTSVSNEQFAPVAVSDGVGGAIVAWTQRHTVDDLNNYDVYAQRINSAGALLWGSSGVPLCVVPQFRTSLVIISDGRNSPAIGGSPGAIVAWEDGRAGITHDIYSQAVDASGTVRWTTNGVPVCTASSSQTVPAMVTDGIGLNAFSPKGAIITWRDSRNSNGNNDIYAQRLNVGGVPQWTANGIMVCTNSSHQEWPAAAYTGPGNAIIAWPDSRDGGYGLYAQRVGASGGEWLADGLLVSQASGSAQTPEMIGDGKGGAIMVWEAFDLPHRILMQRVNGNGLPIWTADGLQLCGGPTIGGQFGPAVIGVAGGAIVAWEDRRNGIEFQNGNIYIQRVDSAGVAQWNPDGLPVCQALGIQHSATLASDGAGGAIMAWTDARNSDVDRDIYANHVTGDGNVVGVGAVRVDDFKLLAPFPNPTAGSVDISFQLSEVRTVTAQIFGVDGRLIRTLTRQEFSAGLHALHWDGSNDSYTRVRTGVYFIRMSAGATSNICKVLLID